MRDKSQNRFFATPRHLLTLPSMRDKISLHKKPNTRGKVYLANNSINGRFRELYKEVEDNLSDESKDLLNALYKRGSKSLHEYRNSLLEILNNEYLKIVNELAIEHNISVEEIECRMIGNQWDGYMIAIEKLNEPIHKYRSEEEINEEYEEMMEPYRNQSEEETAYWQDLREAVYGYDEDDDDFISDEDDDEELFDEEDDEEYQRDMYVSKIETILQNRLTSVINETKNKLNVTGQVIDFMLHIYDISQPMFFSFKD